MAGWNDWIYVVAAPHPLTERGEEVERAVDDDLARTLQTRLRTSVDPGIDLRTGARAAAIRVVADGNRLVIRQGDDQGLRRSEPDDRSPRPTELDDLFANSMAAPQVLDDGRIAFRTIREEHLFGSLEWRDELVDRAAQEVVRGELVDAYERAVKQVALEHPSGRVS